MKEMEMEMEVEGWRKEMEAQKKEKNEGNKHNDILNERMKDRNETK